MALTDCRECGKRVSDEAPTCPDCGAPEPSRRPPVPDVVVADVEPIRPAQRAKKAAVLTAILAVVLLIIWLTSGTDALVGTVIWGAIIIAVLTALVIGVRNGADKDAKKVCSHCQERGNVRTRPVRVKDGISGGKATGAVLTGGLSMFATGLSQKKNLTEATCGRCGAKWLY